MLQEPNVLDQVGRAVVLTAIRQHCSHRGWNLLATMEAEAQPERIMNEFKSSAKRELSRLERDGPDHRRWARHGSTRWPWRDEDVRQALHYVFEEQGGTDEAVRWGRFLNTTPEVRAPNLRTGRKPF